MTGRTCLPLSSRLELVLKRALDLQKLQLKAKDGARLDDFSALHEKQESGMFSTIGSRNSAASAQQRQDPNELGQNI